MAGDTPSTTPSRLDWRIASLLELFALTGLTIAQPIFDIFADAPEELVFANARGFDLVLFTAIILLTPPLLLLVAELVVDVADTEVRTYLHATFVGALVGLFVGEVTKEATEVGTGWLWIIGLGVAAVITVLRHRTHGLGAWLRLLAVAPAALALWFVALSPAHEATFGGGSSTSANIQADGDASVLFLVFDELPTMSLLDEENGIDAELFPNFASLAATSTWYRNNTTVAPSTPTAVPALLDGRLPTATDRLPVPDEYPQNVFTMLGGEFDMHVVEAATRICPDRICGTEARSLDDTPLSYLLPDAVDAWIDFASPRRSDGSVDFKIPQSDPSADRKVDTFITELDTGATARRFDFMHVLMPHQPWWRLADGRRYGGVDGVKAPILALGLDGPSYAWNSPAAANGGRLRHLLQLQYTDVVLGRILEGLRSTSRFDDTVIVVTADHGVSFTAGQPIRGLGDDNAEQIMWAPLFIKSAGQVRGELNERPVQSIDVVPTLLDELGITSPWPLDGVSALDGRPAAPDTRTFTDWKTSAEHPSDGLFNEIDGATYYRRMLDAPPAAPAGPAELRVHQAGTYGSLVGQPAEPLLGTPSDLRAAMTNQTRSLNLSETRLDAYVGGTVDTSTPIDLAVIANGVIAATTKTISGDDGQEYGTVLPPALLLEGDNRFELAVIDASGPEPLLRPVKLSS